MRHLMILFFLFLSFCLWLGDGQQGSVDIICAFGVVFFTIFIPKVIKRQRFIDPLQATLGAVFLLYGVLRTVYSDDIGYSFYIWMRYLSAATIYYLCYCYIKKDMLNTIVHAVFGFSLFAMLSAIVLLLFPHLYEFHQMNLLTVKYAHNTVIIPILFSCASSVYVWLETKRTRYLVLSSLFFIGSVLCFSRAALIAETIIILGILIVRYFGKHRIQLQEILVSIAVVIGGVLIFSIPYSKIPQSFPLLKADVKLQNPISDRRMYWTQAITAIKEQPIVGYGPGTVFIQSTRLQQEALTYVLFSHNLLLESLVDLGILGTLPLLIILFTVVRAYLRVVRTKHKDTKNFVYINALVISMVSIAFYGMADFPLNFFVPLLLWWALAGTVAGIGASSTNSKQRVSLWIFRCCQILLLICALVAMFDQLMVRWKYTPCEQIRGFRLQLCLMRNTNGTIPITQKDLERYELLHKKNPAVLFTIGYKQESLGNISVAKRLYRTSVLYNPYNQYNYYEYLDLLTSEKNTQELGKELETLSCMTFPKAFCERIKQFQLTSPTYAQALLSVFSRPNGQHLYQDYAVIFYRLGKYFLQTKPEITEELWTFIRDAHPGWAPFHIELASLYQDVFQDNKKATAVLQNCLVYKAAKDECTQWLSEPLPRPGNLEERIINQWEY